MEEPVPGAWKRSFRIRNKSRATTKDEEVNRWGEKNRKRESRQPSDGLHVKRRSWRLRGGGAERRFLFHLYLRVEGITGELIYSWVFVRPRWPTGWQLLHAYQQNKTPICIFERCSLKSQIVQQKTNHRMLLLSIIYF